MADTDTDRNSGSDGLEPELVKTDEGAIAVKVRLPLITVSELKAHRRCKRQHHLTYRLGYRDVAKAGPLRFGTAVHAALEPWWRPGTGQKSIDLALASIDADGEMDPFERAKARSMLIAYHARWSTQDLEVLGVEVEFEAPLVNPTTGAHSRTFRVGGKIDAIARKPNGQVFIVEHKTSGVECGLDSAYWRKLRIDPQISTYLVGARAIGHDVAGCIYDVLRKPAIRPKEVPITDEDGVKIVVDRQGNRVRTKDQKKWRETSSKEDGYTLTTRPETPEEFEARCLQTIAEDPDRHLVRGEVYRLDMEEEDAAQDLWEQARDLKESENAKRFPRNPDACEQFGRFCSYFEVCTGSASLDDPTLFRRTTTKHEELGGTK